MMTKQSFVIGQYYVNRSSLLDRGCVKTKFWSFFGGAKTIANFKQIEYVAY